MNDVKELITKLNDSREKYYNHDDSPLSDTEYDELYNELKSIENETGIVYSNSPTNNVGYRPLQSELETKKHHTKILSLDSTKEVNDLISFIGDEECILSLKMDGLTIVIEYNNGVLENAITRGDGEYGEDVTNNVKTIKNVPLYIPYKGKLIVRGEAILTYTEFERINNSSDNIYKNPRNLCSGSIRQLDPNVTADRDIKFYPFTIVYIDDNLFTTFSSIHEWLKSIGFDNVIHLTNINSANIKKHIKFCEDNLSKSDIPSDGMVLSYDNIKYGKSLGETSHHPKHSIAFKWTETFIKTTLEDIEYNVSRRGIITPIAIFKPVEINGTTVSRATIHNLNYFEKLELGINDEITVYKANLIIPEIYENITKSNTFKIPDKCPICSEATEIIITDTSKYLKCSNTNCIGKNIESIIHFCSKKCMNIEGMGESTVSKLVKAGFIKNTHEIYILSTYNDKIYELPGFGKKSVAKLLKNIENSKVDVDLPKFIKALGIPEIGKSVGKAICDFYNYDITKIFNPNISIDELSSIKNIGNTISNNYIDYITNHQEELNKFIKIMTFKTNNKQKNTNGYKNIQGKSFAITGKLDIYNNRDELELFIINHGGKISKNVTTKTDYLINNDSLSESSKNKKARELNIKIITENEFKALLF